ncbi:myb-like protein F isoform X2 [Nymphalis io]|nr:myb-like protein F isoform X2 [Nymphalis io]
MKIADTAVERIKKSIHHNNFCNDEMYPSLHFCPTCVAVIKLKDQINHEKSIAHKNSLIVNKFLNDFYLLYTDNNNCEDYDVLLDKKTNNFNRFNDNEVKKSKGTNDNLDNSIDSVSFKSETDSGSIFKECDSDLSDRNKKDNNSDRTISPNVNTIIKNKETTSKMLPINVSNSVEDKNKDEMIEDKTTLEDASNNSPKAMKSDTKKKKTKTKINAGISQDLFSKGEKNQINCQSPISLSTVDNVSTGEVTKNIPEVIKTGKPKKVKTKNNKETNEDIVEILKEKDKNGIDDFISFFGDDIKVEDIKKTPEVVKKENSKMKKVKTKKDTNEKNRSTNSLSFFVDSRDITVEETSEKPAEDFETGITRKNGMENDKEKNKLKEMDRENENKLCKICNNNEINDHSVCLFLWNELCEKFNTENEKNDGFIINNMLPFDIYYHLIIKCNTPYCMVCKINFYGEVDIITHLLSKEHINSYKALISDHFLILENNVTTCKVCDVKFKKEFELLHCEDIKHITRQEKYKRQLGKMNAL